MRPSDEARALGVEQVDLPTLLGRSDVVSLHAPLLAETRQLLGAMRTMQQRISQTVSHVQDNAALVSDASVQLLASWRTLLCETMEKYTTSLRLTASARALAGWSACRS